MPSPFYSQVFERPFPVTFLMVERLDTLMSGNAGMLTQDMLIDVLLNPGRLSDPSTEDLNYLASRLVEETRSPVKRPTAKVPGRSFGSALYEHWGALDLVGQMVGVWGMQEARRMYCEEDKDDVLLALRLAHKEASAKHSMLWEAFLYASGGRYNDDRQDGNMTVIDLTSGGDAALADLERAINAANALFH